MSSSNAEVFSKKEIPVEYVGDVSFETEALESVKGFDLYDILKDSNITDLSHLGDNFKLSWKVQHFPDGKFKYQIMLGIGAASGSFLEEGEYYGVFNTPQEAVDALLAAYPKRDLSEEPGDNRFDEEE